MGPSKNSEKKWYVVYTRSRSEKKLRDSLNSKNIECYLPLGLQKKKWSDRIKVIEEPLFKSYVFVHIDYGQESRAVLSDTYAVQFVQFNGEVATIPEDDIEMIQHFERSYPERIQLEREEKLQPGKKLEIKHGVFAGRTVEVEKRHKTAAVKVKLPMLNTIASVEVSLEDLGLEDLS